MEASTPTQWYVQCCNLKTHQLVVGNGKAQGGSQGDLRFTLSFGCDVTRSSRRVGFATAGVSLQSGGEHRGEGAGDRKSSI